MGNKIDWNQVQSEYDSSKRGIREICKMFGISTARLHRATKKGIFITRDKSELLKIKIERGKERKHSKETKEKISKSRSKYLLDNPDKVPYRLNHSSKESYPEKYFNEIFTNEGIKLERYYRVGLYELDFALVDKKIDIEIDGDQHYLDPKVTEIDIRRDRYLSDNGWKIIRIKWSEYKKISKEEKEDCIKWIRCIAAIAPDS